MISDWCTRVADQPTTSSFARSYLVIVSILAMAQNPLIVESSLHEMLHRRLAMNTVEQYRSVEQWCTNAIRCNAGFLYNTDLFDKSINDASSSFGIPPQVRTERQHKLRDWTTTLKLLGCLTEQQDTNPDCAFLLSVVHLNGGRSSLSIRSFGIFILLT